jgi:putative tryptophan/tyrosine transport system substrate-binding protein
MSALGGKAEIFCSIRALPVVCRVSDAGQRRPCVIHRTEDEIAAAFAAFAEGQPTALIVGQFSSLANNSDKIRAQAARHRVPTIYPFAFYVRAGGLINYGIAAANSFRQAAAIHVALILNGTKPGELPVMEATRYELVVNLRTARTLGLTVPRLILVRADEVIE